MPPWAASSPVVRSAEPAEIRECARANIEPDLPIGTQPELMKSTTYSCADCYEVFSQTEMCCLLSLVKGSRSQSLQRPRRVIPASRAIRSSSDGHT